MWKYLFLGFPRTQLHWGAVLSFKHPSPSETISICKKMKYFQQLREVVKYYIYTHSPTIVQEVFDGLPCITPSCKFSGLCSFLCLNFQEFALLLVSEWKDISETKCTDRKLSANGLVLMAWSVLVNFLSRHILGPDPAGISWFEYMKVFRRLWRSCCYFE